ncbi:GNAT family N-acetyltransferase [Streptomyces sp. 7N604]|uniref:GNAT family N-acetyltransferase n=1 Tax=Streptomyces sp. 7N604 TaxID=3457415 RepID=UPI003FD0A607
MNRPPPLCSTDAAWAIGPVPVDHPDAVAVLRLYTAEMAGRYYGRTATEQEIDDALAEDPSTDLVPPTGVFLLARDRQGVAGAVGLRRLAPRITELTRLFVHPRQRRGGGGARLLAAAERAARELRATTMRLETRSDLVEARNLYARQGYTEIPPYNNAPYAEHWFEKHLG